MLKLTTFGLFFIAVGLVAIIKAFVISARWEAKLKRRKSIGDTEKLIDLSTCLIHRLITTFSMNFTFHIKTKWQKKKLWKWFKNEGMANRRLKSFFFCWNWQPLHILCRAKVFCLSYNVAFQFLFSVCFLPSRSLLLAFEWWTRDSERGIWCREVVNEEIFSFLFWIFIFMFGFLAGNDEGSPKLQIPNSS